MAHTTIEPAPATRPAPFDALVPLAPSERSARSPLQQPAAPQPLWQAGGALALVFGILASVVSFAGSWIPSLWGDEAASALSAQRPLPSLFMMLGHVDAVHGTYYLGLHAWVRVFGASPLSIRAPSAIAVGIAAAAVVLICARLGSRRLAVIAGVVAVVLPRMTYAGEEARSFAFDAAVAATLTLLLVELLMRSGRPRWLWLAYYVGLCLGCYLFLYVALMALAHVVVLALVRPPRRFFAAWATATAVALIAATPVAGWAFLERAQIAYLAHQPQVTAQSILVWLWFGNGWFAAVGWTLMAAGVGLAAMAWWRAGRAARAKPPIVEIVALCWLAIPTLVLVAGSGVEHDFTARYLTFCAPAAVILIACGIDRLARLCPPAMFASANGRWRQAIAAIVTAGVVASALPVYVAQREPYAKNDSDWAAIAATVHAHAQAGDAIAFDDSTRPSRRTRLAMDAYPSSFAGLRDLMLERPYARNTTWHDADLSMPQAVAEGRLHDVQRLWLVEYALPGHIDTWGLPTLRAEGFTTVRRFSEHSSVVLELERDAAGRQTADRTTTAQTTRNPA